ncbi:MauE/DoxX family redox-associated membrane protein [Flavobacterium sp. FlaQc-48]|uniref:MauE/DoxX family redox-associated membrane protein n=1 Tax=Flavobacterium sp. FlaQc-48 TaxID=3374181 RepID=UPI0037583A84
MRLIMKPGFKTFIVEVICLLYILLFVYAAVSKLLDFENFKIQMGQSPILSSFAGWMVIFIPLLEFGIAILLIFRGLKFWGLLLSFLLMFLFSLYIYIMLNYSSYIPCSCGGILEKMTWKQHLAFNIFFTVLALIAFILHPYGSKTNNRYMQIITFKITLILAAVFFGGLVMILMFRFTDNIIHYKNNFIRRFPQHTAQEIYQIDLKFNSYYFAGSDEDKIYLGNSTAPLKVIVLDTLSKQITQQNITLERIKMPFSVPVVRVSNGHFFVYEGTVPYIFSGSTVDWRANLKLKSGYYFSNAVSVDSTLLAVRYINPLTNENAVGLVDLKDTLKSKISTDLLEKQFDGIFDTDGALIYNHEIKKIIYVYYYRNEYMLISNQLKLSIKGNTIDTVSTAHVDLVKNPKTGKITFSKPPLRVNRLIASYGNLLFVNSSLPGQYESEYLWKTASIIDVYDLSDQSYRSSFPIYNIGRKKMRGMYVYGDHLYALIDQKLVCYKLRSHITQNR